MAIPDRCTVSNIPVYHAYMYSLKSPKIHHPSIVITTRYQDQYGHFANSTNIPALVVVFRKLINFTEYIAMNGTYVENDMMSAKKVEPLPN